MAKSLKLNFSKGGATISVDEVVEGFAAVAQNGMVNIATARGSDPGDPKRGTTLLEDALHGKVVDFLAAQHISQLAALDTLFYLRSKDPVPTEEERVDSLDLEPFDYDGEQVKLNTVFRGTGGTVIGREDLV